MRWRADVAQRPKGSPLSTKDLSQLKIDRQAQPEAAHGLRPWLIGGAVLAILAGSVWWAVGASPIAVETANVGTSYPYQALTVLNASGYVVAQRKAAVSSKASGRLEWLGVAEGSVVKQDQVVARLESRDVRAQADQARAALGVAQAGVGQARAELTEAEAAWRRTADLAARKFVAASAVDSAQARLARAQAGVASAGAAVRAAEAAARVAQVAVEQTEIRAPFDGVVLTKTANVGDILTPFSSALDTKGAVVTLADMSTLEVEADVSESSVARIQPGQPCEIQLDAFPEVRLRGEVSRLVPTVDRAKATVMTKVRFVDRDSRVLPEMSAKVAFLSAPVPPERRQPLTVVNPEAVATRGDQRVVFLVEGDAVRQTPVQVGERLGESVAVSGVKTGQKVVLRPPPELRDGATVKVGGKG